MSALIIYQPQGASPGSIARIVWHASQALLAAARDGRRDLASSMGAWLANTRSDPRCTPAMQRVIDSALSIALQKFGGTLPSFEPAHPDDGEVA